MPPNGEPPLNLQTLSDHALLHFTSCKIEHFPQASGWSSRGWPGQLKGPQNEHEESGRISGIWKQLSTFTNRQSTVLGVCDSGTNSTAKRGRGRTGARSIQVLAVTLKATHPSMGQLLSTSTKLFNSQLYHVFHQELLA